MKRLFRLSFALILAGIIALLGTMSPVFGKTVQGEVVSMDASGFVIRSPDGQVSEYTLGTGVVVPADVRTGAMVEVAVGEGESGSIITAIAAVPAAGSLPATTPSSGQTPSESPASANQPSTSTSDSELPATAGTTWAVGLLGTAILAGWIALNRRRRSRPRTYYRAS